MAELVDPQTGDTLATGQHSVTHKTTNALIMQTLVEFGSIASQLKRLIGQLAFARDPSDRLRIWSDGGSVNVNGSLTNTYWAASNAYAGYYTTGAPTSMDAREQQRATVRIAANQNRARWSVT